MVIGGVQYTKRDEASKAFHTKLMEYVSKNEAEIGSFMGLRLSISFSVFHNMHLATLRGAMSYEI